MGEFVDNSKFAQSGSHADFSFPEIQFYTYPSNLAKCTCLEGLSGMAEFLADVRPPISNPLMALTSEPLV